MIAVFLDNSVQSTEAEDREELSDCQAWYRVGTDTINWYAIDYTNTNRKDKRRNSDVIIPFIDSIKVFDDGLNDHLLTTTSEMGFPKYFIHLIQARKQR